MNKILRPTRWLASLLNLSVTTIKKMRRDNPNALPPFIKIGNSYRYDENVVEEWLKQKTCNVNEVSYG